MRCGVSKRAGFLLAATVLISTLWASGARAHPAGGPVGGFSPGFLHPFGGLDHLLAMVAVGLLAAQRGGRAIYLLPAAFLGAMAAGFTVALAGGAIPLVETSIPASVIVLGLLVGLSFRIPVVWPAVLVGLFGLVHGHAHGTEAAGLATAYAGGMLLATALLHGSGVAGALLLSRARRPALVRAAGFAVLVLGIGLL
jgi:urease accessory protein